MQVLMGDGFKFYILLIGSFVRRVGFRLDYPCFMLQSLDFIF